ncbi:MAG: NuoI/complex I 23 kDa subunit family protein [Candidatus Asgardarchaeia archaeon]
MVDIKRLPLRVLKPLSVTIRYLFQKPFTVMYPREKLNVSPNYRGIIYLDIEKCIGCGMCARACPNETIEYITKEEDFMTINLNDKKNLKFRRPAIDFGHCMFCALCIEACPTGSLQRHMDYEWHVKNRIEMILLPEELNRLKKYTLREKVERLLDTTLIPKGVGDVFEEEFMKLVNDWRALRNALFAGTITEDEFMKKKEVIIDKAMEIISKLGKGVVFE